MAVYLTTIIGSQHCLLLNLFLATTNVRMLWFSRLKCICCDFCDRSVFLDFCFKLQWLPSFWSPHFQEKTVHTSFFGFWIFVRFLSFTKFSLILNNSDGLIVWWYCCRVHTVDFDWLITNSFNLVDHKAQCLCTLLTYLKTFSFLFYFRNQSIGLQVVTAWVSVQWLSLIFSGEQ